MKLANDEAERDSSRMSSPEDQLLRELVIDREAKLRPVVKTRNR